MIKKSMNNFDAEGILYSHTLEHKSGKQGEFITGKITLLVGENKVRAQCYATPLYSKKKTRNPSYDFMSDIISGEIKSVVNDETGTAIQLRGSVDCSVFPNDKNEIVRSQQFRGQFFYPSKGETTQNKWKVDCAITKIVERDEDEERNIPRHVVVTGYIFDNYNGQANEFVCSAKTDNAMNYFLGLEVSEEAPHFTSLWGKMQTSKRTMVIENAFGEGETQEFEFTEWVVTGAAPEPYEWDSEDTITAADYETYINKLQAKKVELLDNKKVEEDDLPF